MSKKFMSLNELKRQVRSSKITSVRLYRLWRAGKLTGIPKFPKNAPAWPHLHYRSSGWVSWGDLFGTRRVFRRPAAWRPYAKASKFAIGLGITSSQNWDDYCAGRIQGAPPRPDDIPADPAVAYRKSGWKGWPAFLKSDVEYAYGNSVQEMRSFRSARSFVRSLKLDSAEAFKAWIQKEKSAVPKRCKDIPSNPNRHYEDSGWVSWPDFLGTTKIEMRSYARARSFVKKLGLKSVDQFRLWRKGKLPDLPPFPDDIPSNPHVYYAGRGWVSWPEFFDKKYKTYNQARALVQKLKFKSSKQFRLWKSGAMRKNVAPPEDISLFPAHYFRNRGWISWRHFLGPSMIAENRAGRRPRK